jgi:archaellum component FlaC
VKEGTIKNYNLELYRGRSGFDYSDLYGSSVPGALFAGLYKQSEPQISVGPFGLLAKPIAGFDISTVEIDMSAVALGAQAQGVPPGMGGTGFQANILNGIIERLKQNHPLILTPAEREVLLWGLLNSARPEYPKIITILGRLDNSELSHLKDMADRWGRLEDNMFEKLQSALAQAKQSLSSTTEPSNRDRIHSILNDVKKNGLRPQVSEALTSATPLKRFLTGNIVNPTLEWEYSTDPQGVEILTIKVKETNKPLHIYREDGIIKPQNKEFIQSFLEGQILDNLLYSNYSSIFSVMTERPWDIKYDYDSGDIEERVKNTILFVVDLKKVKMEDSDIPSYILQEVYSNAGYGPLERYTTGISLEEIDYILIPQHLKDIVKDCLSFYKDKMVFVDTRKARLSYGKYYQIEIEVPDYESALERIKEQSPGKQFWAHGLRLPTADDERKKSAYAVALRENIEREKTPSEQTNEPSQQIDTSSLQADMQLMDDLVDRFRNGDIDGVVKQLLGIKANIEIYNVYIQALKEKLNPEEMNKLNIALEELRKSESTVDTKPTKLGGIDFRAMPIATQTMQPTLGTVPLGAQIKPMSGTVPVNLDKDWTEIQNMIQRGIIPSAQRIKEYIVVCCKEKGSNGETDKVISCIADILRLEEERCLPTDAALKEILVLLESDRQASEIQLALTKIDVSPKIPKPIEP